MYIYNMAKQSCSGQCLVEADTTKLRLKYGQSGRQKSEFHFYVWFMEMLFSQSR